MQFQDFLAHTQSQAQSNRFGGVERGGDSFQGLLGKPPYIDDEDEDILPILEELNIKTGPFNQEEYDKAKKSLVEGKSCGEDGIPPEVLKRCDVDEIILGFCNRALIDGDKPQINGPY